jgi:hypothetical protein
MADSARGDGHDDLTRSGIGDDDLCQFDRRIRVDGDDSTDSLRHI